MKTILVPVDFSKNSQNAVKYAILLAEKFDARLLLFHSFYSPHISGYMSISGIESGKKKGYQIALLQLKEFYRQFSGQDNLTVEFLVSQRELRQELPAIVQENRIDLIVMGTQGIAAWEGKIFKTNTSWTIQNTNCPVIAIPEKETDLRIGHITYASDFLDSDIANLKTVEGIADVFGADITVFHVEPNDNAGNQTFNIFKEKLKKKINSSLLIFKSIKANNVEKGIEDYVRLNAVDLLVMSTRQRGMFEKLFGKSISKLMVHRLNSPIMFFHH